MGKKLDTYIHAYIMEWKSSGIIHYNDKVACGLELLQEIIVIMANWRVIRWLANSQQREKESSIFCWWCWSWGGVIGAWKGWPCLGSSSVSFKTSCISTALLLRRFLRPLLFTSTICLILSTTTTAGSFTFLLSLLRSLQFSFFLLSPRIFLSAYFEILSDLFISDSVFSRLYFFFLGGGVMRWINGRLSCVPLLFDNVNFSSLHFSLLRFLFIFCYATAVFLIFIFRGFRMFTAFEFLAFFFITFFFFLPLFAFVFFSLFSIFSLLCPLPQNPPLIFSKGSCCWVFFFNLRIVMVNFELVGDCLVIIDAWKYFFLVD